MVAPLNRRVVAAWVSYDFANSSFAAVILATIYAAWYAQVVVGNTAGEGDLWWGRVIALSMAIVAVASPFLGGIADRAGVRRTLLVAMTALAVVATVLMATVQEGMVVRGFVLGVLGNVGFEGALVYYNAWLPEIAPPDRRGRVSGWGYAAGYLGSLVALMAALPFVRSAQPTGAFLVTAALFGICALPAIFFLPAAPSQGIPALRAAREGFSEVTATFRRILGLRDLRRFLAAYFIYEDAVNTVVAFSAIFAAQTLGFSMPQLVILYAVVQVSALAGAIAWSGPTDRLGPRRVVIIVLAQWIVVVILCYVVRTQAQFFVVAVLAGTGLGAVQAASRAFMASLIPRGMEAEMFGFYALCGKSAAILGPLVFGAISSATGGDQRAGVLAVGLFFVVGLLLVARVGAGGPAPAGPAAY